MPFNIRSTVPAVNRSASLPGRRPPLSIAAAEAWDTSIDKYSGTEDSITRNRGYSVPRDVELVRSLQFHRHGGRAIRLGGPGSHAVYSTHFYAGEFHYGPRVQSTGILEASS